MSSREAAISSAADLNARKELTAADYLDIAADQGHIHYSDECPRSKKRLAHLRGQKRESDLRARELVAERDVLYAIVRDLAAVEEPIYDSMYCLLCNGRPDDHTTTCPWSRARELLASGSPEGDTE